jgi:hypothetical protein
MTVFRVTLKGISTNAELPARPMKLLDCMGSFDLKAIRLRMAFGAQDDRI